MSPEPREEHPHPVSARRSVVTRDSWGHFDGYTVETVCLALGVETDYKTGNEAPRCPWSESREVGKHGA